MFSIQDLITSHSVLFSLCYPYLLSSKEKAHSPSQLSDYYLAKITRKSQRMSKKNRYLGNIESHAITALIRGESLKSMTTSGIVQASITFLKLSKGQLPIVSIKQISLYCLRLRSLMAIVLLCRLDLHHEATRHQLSLLMQSVPIVEYDLPGIGESLPQGLLKSHNLMSISRPPINKPWLTCLRFISKLTLDGMVTYRLGMKANKQFNRTYLPKAPLNIIHEY